MAAQKLLSNTPKIEKETLLEILTKVYMQRSNYERNFQTIMVNFFGVPLYSILRALPCGKKYIEENKDEDDQQDLEQVQQSKPRSFNLPSVPKINFKK